MDSLALTIILSTGAFSRIDQSTRGMCVLSFVRSFTRFGAKYINSFIVVINYLKNSQATGGYPGYILESIKNNIDKSIYIRAIRRSFKVGYLLIKIYYHNPALGVKSENAGILFNSSCVNVSAYISYKKHIYELVQYELH